MPAAFAVFFQGGQGKFANIGGDRNDFDTGCVQRPIDALFGPA